MDLDSKALDRLKELEERMDSMEEFREDIDDSIDILSDRLSAVEEASPEFPNDTEEDEV